MTGISLSAYKQFTKPTEFANSAILDFESLNSHYKDCCFLNVGVAHEWDHLMAFPNNEPTSVLNSE